MVKVFHTMKTNAWLGGQLFIGGVCEFTDVEEGVKFASMLHLKYEVIEIEKPAKKPSKKKVKANE